MYRHKYGDITATWERMSDLDARHGWMPPAVAFLGSIYVVGSGGGRGWISKAVSRYDPSLKQWKELKDKKIATNGSAIVTSNGFLYCIGGYNGEAIDGTDRVERLEVASQTWDEVAPMIEMRHRSSAVECNGEIIVAGGWYRGKRVDSVEKYDPGVNQWTSMKPMTEGRSSFRLHLIQGSIFAIGGDIEHKTIERYDFSKDRWENIRVGSEMRIQESVLVRKKNRNKLN